MHDSWPSNFIEPPTVRLPLADTTSSAMHNLNVNLGSSMGPNSSSMSVGAGNLLTVGFGGSGDGCSTPKTPEILNSLIAMSNPFDLRPAASAPRMGSNRNGGQGGYGSNSLLGGTDSSESTSSTPVGSPCGQGPPSVQHTCSQLIKEGLKLTIQSKRKHETFDGTGTDDDNSSGTGGLYGSNIQCPGSSRSGRQTDELTPEDEERRRRRRERNKIAATKCRLKKRERTVNLVQESEILETQNHELKSQIREMETQRTRLIDMLSQHKPRCLRETSAGATQNNNTSTTINYSDQSSTNPTTTTTTADLFNSIHNNNAAFYSNTTYNYITTSASDSEGGCLA